MNNTAAGQTITYVTEASYRTIPRLSFYTMPGWYNGTNLLAQYGATAWAGTIESNGLDLYTSISSLNLTVSGGATPNMIIPIPTRGGRMVAQFRAGAATPSIDFAIRDTLRSEALGGSFLAASGALAYQIDTIMPDRQVEIFIRNRDAVTAVPNITLNLVYDIPN